MSTLRHRPNASERPLRRVVALLSLVLGLVALSPATALGKCRCHDHPVFGMGRSTSVVNIATGLGTTDGTGFSTGAGRLSFHDDFKITLIGPSSFTLTGTDTVTATNGGQVFSTLTGTGSTTGITPGSTLELTENLADTGGTGRFAQETGTSTVTSKSMVVSLVGPVITTTDKWMLRGRVSRCRHNERHR